MSEEKRYKGDWFEDYKLLHSLHCGACKLANILLPFYIKECENCIPAPTPSTPIYTDDTASALTDVKIDIASPVPGESFKHGDNVALEFGLNEDVPCGYAVMPFYLPPQLDGIITQWIDAKRLDKTSILYKDANTGSDVYHVDSIIHWDEQGKFSSSGISYLVWPGTYVMNVFCARSTNEPDIQAFDTATKKMRMNDLDKFPSNVERLSENFGFTSILTSKAPDLLRKGHVVWTSEMATGVSWVFSIDDYVDINYRGRIDEGESHHISAELSNIGNSDSCYVASIHLDDASLIKGDWPVVPDVSKDIFTPVEVSQTKYDFPYNPETKTDEMLLYRCYYSAPGFESDFYYEDVAIAPIKMESDSGKTQQWDCTDENEPCTADKFGATMLKFVDDTYGKHKEFLERVEALGGEEDRKSAGEEPWSRAITFYTMAPEYEDKIDRSFLVRLLPSGDFDYLGTIVAKSPDVVFSNPLIYEEMDYVTCGKIDLVLTAVERKDGYVDMNVKTRDDVAMDWCGARDAPCSSRLRCR